MIDPARVAIVNDYEVVVRGVADMLDGESGLRVVEIDSQADPESTVDIALFDTFAAEQRPADDLRRLLSRPNVAKVVVYTWSLDPALVAEARLAGVHGYVSKRLRGEELAAVLRRVAGGERVFPSASDLDAHQADAQACDPAAGDWPGKRDGLTAREAEVVGLIVQGHTNEQIAKRAYLSINTVKTYIRSAYRKMGVERRSQAVLWGMEHGFLPHRVKESPHA